MAPPIIRRMLDRLQRLELQGSRYCFDEIIRDQENIVVAKNLDDLDELSLKAAEGLRSFSSFLEGVPVVVSEKVSGTKLEDDIVYTRYKLPVVTRRTLEKLIGGSDEPLVYVTKGGVYVRIKGEELRKVRDEKGISRGELARALGVSRRTILYYEKGLSDASLQVALKMEEYIGDRVFARLSLEELKGLVKEPARRGAPGERIRDTALKRLLNVLAAMGFKEYLFSRTPFDAGAKRKPQREARLLIRGEGGEEEDIEEILEVTDSKAILLTESGGVEEEERVLVLPRERVGEIKKHISLLFDTDN